MNATILLLTELRQRVLHILLVFIGLFGIGFIYSAQLFHWYMLPLQRLLPSPHHLIATHITTPVLTPLTLVINLALFCTTPFAIWQIWRFAAPALYRAERRKWRWLLCSSMGLFCIGCLFCYYFILPFMFQCMIQALPQDVLLLPDIISVTQFITEMLIIFGCSFQIPLVCFLLIHMNLLSIDQCSAIRPYMIVVAFILGMLLTPPDVVAQVLLALPLWGLYESGIVLARVFTKSIR